MYVLLFVLLRFFLFRAPFLIGTPKFMSAKRAGSEALRLVHSPWRPAAVSLTASPDSLPRLHESIRLLQVSDYRF